MLLDILPPGFKIPEGYSPNITAEQESMMSETVHLLLVKLLINNF